MSLINDKVIYFLLEMIIFILGLISNLLALITFICSKKLTNIGTKYIYIFLFIIDSLFLVIIFSDRAYFYSGFDMITYSSTICRLYPFLNRILTTLSPMLLVYISIERFLSLQDLTQDYRLRSSKNQISYLIIIILFNCIYYSPCLYFFEIIIKDEKANNNNNYNETLVIINDTMYQDTNEYHIACIIVDDLFSSLIPIMDLINRVMLPSILMIFSSSLLSYELIKINKFQLHFRNNTTTTTSNREKSLIKLAISSILLNLFYVSLILPISIMLVFGGDFTSDLVLFFNFILFCLSYALNFYILFFINSLFRDEFFALFYCRTNSNNQQTQQIQLQQQQQIESNNLL
jgi:hypothetical protein